MKTPPQMCGMPPPLPYSPWLHYGTNEASRPFLLRTLSGQPQLPGGGEVRPANAATQRSVRLVGGGSRHAPRASSAGARAGHAPEFQWA